MQNLSLADRFCDNPGDSPYWNESVWFSFSLPEKQIHGLVQCYFRPSMGMLNGGDPSGTYSWNCLYYNWSHFQSIPGGNQEKFNMRAHNSLSVRVIEPLSSYAISYDYEDFQLDLEWRAIGPMHELKTGDAGQQATAKFHIEQRHWQSPCPSEFTR